MMNETLYDRAKALAYQPYDILIQQDTLSDDTLIYVASNPELSGCKSQGRSIEEAIKNLAEARIDYIYDLLEDDVAVPLPNHETTVTM